MKRVLTALILIPVVTYTVLMGPEWLLWLVAAVVAVLCFHEYEALAAAHGIEKLGMPGYVAGLLLLAPLEREALLVVAVLALVALLSAMRSDDLAKVLPRAATLAFGVVYVFGAWRSAILLHAAARYWLFYALVLTWIGDTAAYYVGKSIGQHRLAPRISPGKSVEGAIASLIASVAFGYFYLMRLVPGVAPWEAAAISAMANVAGQLGDLAESALKRGAGVKDSGALLPGHGGWLDRVDSALFAMPAIWVWITLR